MNTGMIYKGIRYAAVGLIFVSLVWALYKGTGPDARPAGFSFSRAVELYADEKYEESLRNYETSIREHPDFIHAQRGRARTLMQLGRDEEALEAFNEVLERDPGSAVSFANRGILHDRMGLYPQAVADYDRAIKMNSRLGKRLDWLTRFLQNRKENPQALADRLQTLRAAGHGGTD